MKNSTDAQADRVYDNQTRQAQLQKLQNEANGMMLPQVTQAPQQNQQTSSATQTATTSRAPASTQQQAPTSSVKGGALATLANPQGSTGVLAPAPTSTTPVQDAMNKALTMPKLPTAGQAIANPQAAAKAVIDQKAAQVKTAAAELAKKKAAELQASLAAKAKSALPSAVGSAASKLISGFTNPFGK
jgi:cytoskeletal protein RodZ